MHAHLPLGMEGFLLRPGRHMLYVLSTADSPVFEGWHLAENGAQKLILDRNGTPVRYFPQKLHFRVTASTMLDLIGVESSPLQIDTDINSFLRRLSFRLKVFHDLQMTTLEPESVQMLGVPAEVSSEERVYGATFTVPRIPIEDRMVLEVLTPEGDRLCRFHLEF
jgi:hypothetical protein